MTALQVDDVPDALRRKRDEGWSRIGTQMACPDKWKHVLKPAASWFNQ